MKPGIVNVLTIDLEDYYMVSAFESVVTKENWQLHESRIERNTHRVLDILDAANGNNDVKATFFCLGWVGEKYGNLIREMDDGVMKSPATGTTTSSFTA